MSDHPKLRSLAVGVATVLVFLGSMLVWMHGCDLCSLWIQVPMFAGLILFLPAWARQGSSLGSAVLRSVLIVLLAFGLVMAYLEWLHSDYFPRWLLFPRPRIHHRAPNHPAAGNARSPLQFAFVTQWPGVPEPGRSAWQA